MSKYFAVVSKCGIYLHITTRISMAPMTYIEPATVKPKKNRIPTAPPNSGPSAREIMKYEPPAGTIPFVAIALIEIDVRVV